MHARHPWWLHAFRTIDSSAVDISSQHRGQINRGVTSDVDCWSMSARAVGVSGFLDMVLNLCLQKFMKAFGDRPAKHSLLQNKACCVLGTLQTDECNKRAGPGMYNLAHDTTTTGTARYTTGDATGAHPLLWRAAHGCSPRRRDPLCARLANSNF